MKAVCLIVLVAVALQVESMSIFGNSPLSECCKIVNNRLNSVNIKSYQRTDDRSCVKKAFKVVSKKGITNCFDATSQNVLEAIKKFDNKKK